MKRAIPDSAGLTPEQMELVRKIARESVAQVAAELLSVDSAARLASMQRGAQRRVR